MKPTPQLNSSLTAGRSMPLTDWNYQPTLETPQTAAGKSQNLPPIWKLSTDFFGAESSREFVRELIAILWLSALAAWQVIFALYWIVRVV